MKAFFKNIGTASMAIAAFLLILSEFGFSWDGVSKNEISWSSDLQQAQELSLKTGKPILVHFYSGSCNPCRMMEVYTFPNPTIVEMVKSSFIPVKINTDQRQDLKKMYKVSRVPADVVLSPNGQIIHVAVGGQDVNGYGQFLLIAQDKARVMKLNPPKVTPSAPPQIPENIKIEPGGACPIDETPSFDYASIPDEDKARLEFEGYCPVELIQRALWVRGDYNTRYLFEDRLYFFAGKEQLEEFKRNPEKYAPAFQGYDIVVWKERGEKVHGLRIYGVWAVGRVFLFSTAENMIKFEKNPRNYIPQNNN